MSILRERNFAQFKNFMETGCCADVSADEEARFFEKAPKKWIACYLDECAPSSQAERVLMNKRSLDLFDKACYLWGISTENVLHAFSNGSDLLCIHLIKNLSYVPSVSVETELLNRANTRLFALWLSKFRTLSEDAERLLEEKSELCALKDMYIEQQSQP